MHQMDVPKMSRLVDCFIMGPLKGKMSPFRARDVVSFMEMVRLALRNGNGINPPKHFEMGVLIDYLTYNMTSRVIVPGVVAH